MKTKKIILLTIIMLFMIFGLCGCTRQEYEVNINDNDSVELSMKILISKESYNLMSSFGIDINELEENKIEGTGTTVDQVNVLFQESAMLLNNYGFEITPLDDAVELGFSAKKTYLTIEEFNSEIKELCENNLSGLNLDIQYVNKTNNKEYKAYGTLNYLLDKDMGLDDETIKSYFDKQYDSSNMTAVVYINMPLSTTVTNHDGTQSSTGSAIQWNTSYSEGEKEVHIISSYKDNTLYYIFGVIIFIIVIIIGIFISRALKLKNEKKNSALSETYEEEREQNL